MKLRHWLIFILLLVSGSMGLKAQEAGIKTNLLGWATTNANIGVEVGVAHRSTISITGSLNPWDFSKDRHLRSWTAMPEYRYWFCEKFSGHFLGIHALGGQYNAKNVNFPLKPLIVASTVTPGADPADPASSEKGWPDLAGDLNHGRHAEGWMVGGGITYGYQWMLGRHWNLEASIGVGYPYSEMKLYGRCDRVIDRRKLHYVGPTHATVAFMYVF